MSFVSEVDAPREEVFAWHTRPGAISRLTPPWLPVKVVSEAGDLRNGRAVLSMAGLWDWVAQHQPEAYREPGAFADELASAPLGLVHWRHTHTFNEAGPGRTEVVDKLETNVPAFAVREMFAYRQRQLADDLRAHSWASHLRPGPMTVAVTGSSGSIGSALTAFLTSGGHRVVRLVRRPGRGPDERQWDTEHPAPDLLDGVDAVVHLAGKPILGRFSDDHKMGLLASRVGPTRRLAEVAAGAKAAGNGPATFVSASAVGYYGPDRGDEVLTEDSERGDGFLADLVGQWEAATAPARDGGLRVVRVRTGIVQTPRGGMLHVLYPVYWAGLGGRLGDGHQWSSWVGIDDLVDIYLRAIVDPAISGAVNAVAPRAVTNSEYATTLARVLGRPALFAVPGWAPKLVVGEEGAREFVLAGQNVKPAALQAAGHQFRHPDLGTALRHLLGRWLARGGPGGTAGAKGASERPALVL